MPASCLTCRFFQAHEGEQGKCHRTAPQVGMFAHEINGQMALLPGSDWPLTKADYWCGEYSSGRWRQKAFLSLIALLALCAYIAFAQALIKPEGHIHGDERTLVGQSHNEEKEAIVGKIHEAGK